MESDGKERWRVEGYLPKEEFRAGLEMGIARSAFMRTRWAVAEQKYARVVERYPESAVAPEAVFWRGASEYMHTQNHAAMEEVFDLLNQKYPESIWVKKASVWGH